MKEVETLVKIIDNSCFHDCSDLKMVCLKQNEVDC